MNHMYKVVFNKATQTFTAVAENAKGQGKGSTVSGTDSKRTTKHITAKLSYLGLAIATALIVSPVYAQDVYLHVNDGSNTGGNSNTNAGTIGTSSGAVTTGSIAIGMNTQAGQDLTLNDRRPKYNCHWH